MLPDYTGDKNNSYFAAREAKDVANVLINKGASFFNYLRSNDYMTKIVDNWRYYYGLFNNDISYGHKVSFTGEQGELVNLPVNHFRNIAQHIYVMITANRPSMEARSVNTDAKSLTQTYLANGILDYYMRERGLEDALKIATEMAVILGSGYIKMEWNATAGEEYDFDEDTLESTYTGDIEFSNLSPLDVVFDGTKESWKQDWVMTRTFKNRYDLAAKYPEQAEKIKGLRTKADEQNYRLALWSNDDTDDVAVYEFFHKKTESLKKGRYILFLSSDIVLIDMPLPYQQLPVFRITPGNILGTPYGYTPMFDLFPLQEAINSLYSTILTNQNAFGVQNIWFPPGSNNSIASLEGGMNIIQSAEKPEAVQLTNTPAEVFEFAKFLIQTMETLSAVNSVTRGNPESSLKSGNALALVQSMALQYISGFQQSYVRMIEEVGTQLINNLKDFAKAPRIAAIVGKSNRTELKEFSSEDLTNINRVVVDIGNPLARTTAGRVQMAEQMLQMNLLKTPEQYFQVINTGKLDTVFEGEVHELILIKQENERMMDGNNPIVSPLDKHKTHIQEHKSVLADSELRENPEVVKVVMEHIQGHLDALRHTDPALLQLVGETPLAPPMPMMPGIPGAPMPGTADQSGSMAPVMQQQNPLPEVGEEISDVSLPAPANPPAPFQNAPVLASEKLPQ